MYMYSWKIHVHVYVHVRNLHMLLPSFLLLAFRAATCGAFGAAAEPVLSDGGFSLGRVKMALSEAEESLQVP